MRRCSICLQRFKLWNTKCCNIYVHYNCQLSWGNVCIICKKQIKCVSTNCFRYTPDYPELTPQEIEDNNRAMEEIERYRRQNPVLVTLIESIVDVFAEDEDDVNIIR